MQEKHEQLGEFGAIPGAPNGPPADNLSQSRKDAENGNGSRSVDENAPECSLPAPEIPTPEKLTPAPAVLCDSAPLREPEKSEQKCAFSPREIEIHDAANIFPPMSDAEFAAFLADIRVNGQSDPIWIFEGKVIDGRHRLRACRELGIEPKFQQWDGKGSLTSFVLSKNLHRRHLNESQRAMVAARLKPAFEDDAQRRVLAGKELDPSYNCNTGRSSETVGKSLNVSYQSVERARKVLQNGVPELIAAVDQSKLAVSKAALIAQFSKEQQMKLLAMSSAEMSAAVRALIAERKRERPFAACKMKAEQRGWSDRRLLETFTCLGAKLTKTGRFYRLELTRNWQDELCKAVYQREQFLKLIRTGVLIVTEEDVA